MRNAFATVINLNDIIRYIFLKKMSKLENEHEFYIQK